MRRQLSIDEIIGTLNHLSTPAVLVEGVNDVIWYRNFESDLMDGAALFPVGGRNTLMEVYKRRSEIKLRVAFVADKDMYVFDGIPDELNEVIFTCGYSIENDLLKNSRIVHSIFVTKELQCICAMKRPLSRWFAFCVEEMRLSHGVDMKAHPQKVLEEIDSEIRIRPQYAIDINFHEPNNNLVNDIFDNFEDRFRGKTLGQLYAFVLSKRKDSSAGCKFSDSQLLELSSKDEESCARKRFVSEINTKLKVYQ